MENTDISCINKLVKDSSYTRFELTEAQFTKAKETKITVIVYQPETSKRDTLFGTPSGNSYIINLKMVQEITKDSALLVDGTSIPISRSYYKALKDQINNLIP